MYKLCHKNLLICTPNARWHFKCLKLHLYTGYDTCASRCIQFERSRYAKCALQTGIPKLYQSFGFLSLTTTFLSYSHILTIFSIFYIVTNCTWLCVVYFNFIYCVCFCVCIKSYLQLKYCVYKVSQDSFEILHIQNKPFDIWLNRASKIMRTLGIVNWINQHNKYIHNKNSNSKIKPPQKQYTDLSNYHFQLTPHSLYTLFT